MTNFIFLIQVISGISIISVPTGTIKRIDDLGVFLITASFSIFAYVWLFIVLKVWSKDEIEIVEAVLTLLFFIILIVLAFVADKYNAYKKKKAAKKRALEAGESIEDDRKRRATVNKDDYYRIVGLQKDKDLMERKRSKSSRNVPIKESIDPHGDLEREGLLNDGKNTPGGGTQQDFLDTEFKGNSVKDINTEPKTITLGFGNDDQGGELAEDSWKVNPTSIPFEIEYFEKK